MSRRAQLQTLEPIIIVILLVIILGMVLLFAVRIGDSQARSDISRQQAQEDLVTLARLSNLPELACARSVTVRTYCIDAQKARAFTGLLDDDRRLYYFTLFGASRIRLQWIDLGSNEVEELILYDALAPGADIRVSRTYFTMYEPVGQTSQFATIVVEHER